MLRLLLPIVLLCFGIGGGVAAGIFWAPRQSASGDGTEQTNGAEDAAEAPAEAPRADGPAQPGGATEFVRLNNQFVVPIVRGGAVRSLVVLSLTIEVDTGQNSAVFDREPRLRDSFLRVLFAHANAGGFDGSFTDATAMDPLREALNETARIVLGRVVHDVLIVDITRQDA